MYETSEIPVRGYDEVASHAVSAIRIEKIQTMTRSELLLLKSELRLGGAWGIFSFPVDWMPLSQVRGGFTVDLNHRVKNFAKQLDKELAITTLTRLLILALCTPSTTGQKHRKVLSPTTVYACLTSPWISLINKALAKPRTDGMLLSRLGWDDPLSYREKLELKRLEDFKLRGLWTDLSAGTPLRSREQSNRGYKRSNQTLPTKNPYQPLPDQFVHEAGRRSAWIIQELTPILLKAYVSLARLRHNDSSEFTRRSSRLLAKYEWKNQAGEPLSNLPFELRLRGFRDLPRWPPMCWEHLNAFLNMAQMANYFVIALSAGPRASEILSFQTDCLRTLPDGSIVADGRTFKLAEAYTGNDREWPMPDLAVNALKNQIALSRMVPPPNKRVLSKNDGEVMPLWRILDANMGYGGALRGTYNHELRRYIENLELSHLLDDQPLTNHRFRKTLARLVAIAHVHAPKILMDIFGHASIETTMHYIMTNPNTRAEVAEVRKELILMVAHRAIKNSDINDGPAAITIRKAISTIRFNHAGDFGAEDEHELALLLTSHGRFWQYVRPGVICTKLQDQVGPCAIGKSTPNPGRCQTDCSYRLEESENRKQVDANLAELVRIVEQAYAKNDDILVELWEKQLLEQLNRFSDLATRWKTHELVASLLIKHEGR